jgi:hypothetical protein
VSRGLGRVGPVGTVGTGCIGALKQSEGELLIHETLVNKTTKKN